MSDILEEPERPEVDQKISELEIMKQSLDASKAKEKELYDQLLRLGAEFENFRKRTELRLGEARRMGQEFVLLPIIGLADALIQAERASENAKDLSSIKTGLSLVFQEFERFLKDQGILAINSVGEKMDPLFHEVIAQDCREDLEEGTIIEEIQRGYTLNGRVIRPARVRVSTQPKLDAATKTEE